MRNNGYLYRDYQKVCADFVRIELDLARTFCEVALQGEPGDERFHRALDKAKLAYRTARKFSDRLDTEHRTEAKKKLQQVSAVLAEVRRRKTSRSRRSSLGLPGSRFGA